MEEDKQPAVTVTPPQWQFNPETVPQQGEQPVGVPTVPDDSVTWTASEYIAHHKPASWYILLVMATIVGAALVYLLTRDMISTIVIVIVAAIFGIFAARQPRVLEYRVDGHGLKIGEKQYLYSQFKSFAVMQDEGIESVSLVPLKRFMPIMSIYFAPDDADKIINLLGDYLPHEERRTDPIDSLMKRLRF